MIKDIATPEMSGIAERMAVWPPAASAPKAATPIAPPVCRTVFKTAEAVPDNDLSTLAKIPVIIAGTAIPMPTGIIRKGKNNCQYGVFSVAQNNPAKPMAKITSPANIDGPIPNRLITFPLIKLVITKPMVKGRKARPAVIEG